MSYLPGLSPLGLSGSSTQSPPSHSSDQPRQKQDALTLPLTEACQDIPDLEERKPWQLHSAEPPDHLEKTGATAGRGLGEDPDCPALSTRPGSLLLSPLRLAGECDGRQRGDQ